MLFSVSGVPVLYILVHHKHLQQWGQDPAHPHHNHHPLRASSRTLAHQVKTLTNPGLQFQLSAKGRKRTEHRIDLCREHLTNLKRTKNGALLTFMHNSSL
jgi:hypothetical protein